ncbi:YoaK family protein [Actomonas aquatica]|uniref:YoaK family protein n=1 Tax=Actomonas aquatica TaxID=2866162 RepID=A0ABZ1C5L3_9BACT|nr:YoaK family protein [Opitutus sp. WL0086]WRQ85809.1 YoaK family protein [Opitutus sp. WL0086]
MQHLNPRLVLLGGCILAFGASVVNVTFILQAGTSVSHLTGDLSRIGRDVANESGAFNTDLLRVTAATLGFILGAATSGFLIHHPQLEIARPYGRTLSSMGLLLLLSAYLRADHLVAAIAIAGFTCGMQNALASRYRGVVLRTTHVTGILTDLGITLGMKLRGHAIERWKLEIPFLLAVSFFTGAVCGSVLNLTTELPVLLLCGIAYILGGLGVTITKRLPSRKSATPA